MRSSTNWVWEEAEKKGLFPKYSKYLGPIIVGANTIRNTVDVDMPDDILEKIIGTHIEVCLMMFQEGLNA